MICRAVRQRWTTWWDVCPLTESWLETRGFNHSLLKLALYRLVLRCNGLDLWDGHCSSRQRNSQGLADLTCTSVKTDASVTFRGVLQDPEVPSPSTETEPASRTATFTLERPGVATTRIYILYGDPVPARRLYFFDWEHRDLLPPGFQEAA